MKLTHKKSKRVIVPEYIDTIRIYNVPIYSQDESKFLGRALLFEPEAAPIPHLLDILIYDEDERGKGAGDDLMDYLCDTFPIIVTGKSSKGGRGLCIKHGFIAEHDKKTNIKYLVYKRKERVDCFDEEPNGEEL